MIDETEGAIQPHPEWAEDEISRRRRQAYADPDNGSDRLFAKAARLEAMGDAQGAQEAKEQALVVAQAIREMYPYPAPDAPLE